jgi:hypothetical protein
MKRLLPLLFVLLSLSGFAQNTINNYKYVIVPEKFSFQKELNQYKLNVLSKNLMAEKGFTAYIDNADLPTEIAADKCKALHLDVLERNTMFSTNLTLILKDCKGNILFKGKEGKSREKDFEVGYNLALRDAFKSLEATAYTYTPSAAANTPVVNTATVNTATVNSATANTATVNSVTVNSVPATDQSPAPASAQLYAQATSTGFQLIDTSPKIRLTLFKTSAADFYIAGNGVENGIVFKKSGSWYFEYYQNNKLVTETLQIKF